MIGAIVQARVGSSRLPGKVLLKLGEKTVLERVLERTSMAQKVEEVILATSIKKEDTVLAKIALEAGFRVFCGSEDDVLDRFYQCARLTGMEHIVRITADCPLIDPSKIDMVVEEHISSGADLTVVGESFVEGFDFGVISFKALKRAWKEARLLSEREHVFPYILKNRNAFKVHVVEHPDPPDEYYRLSLDYEEDYWVIRIVFESLYPQNPRFTMEDVIEFMKKHPALAKLNSHIPRDDGMRRSLAKDGPVETLPCD